LRKKLFLVLILFIGSLFTISSKADILYPPSVHPYIFVNENFLNDVKLNKNTIYAESYKKVSNLASKTLPEITNGNKPLVKADISNIIEAKAFMYLLGVITHEEAEKVVDYTIKYIENPVPDATFGSTAYYNNIGSYAIKTGAFVYDWCYNAMTNTQKETLSKLLEDLMYASVQPVPPNSENWGGVAGKAVGGPMLYNAVASAAIYNEKPKAYNDCMPKIQGIMAEAANYFSTKGALCDASISYIREHISLQVSVLFDRMGHDGIFDDFSKTGYKLMYSRTPYGALLKIGDDGNASKYKIGSYTNGNEATVFGILSLKTGNPYFRFQYMKEFSKTSSLNKLLLTDGSVATKLPDDLPLSFFVDEPRSEIMARTSWLDGLDSPAVVGYMNMHNRRSGDHDHGEAGSFQIYYKGPLTMPGGVYTGDNWGSAHWSNYLSRSISANTVTVYNPSETFKYGSYTATANDGGQMMVANKNSGFVIENLYEFQAENNHRATLESHYIGPDDITPAFSYIKGDLTKSYSPEKMESYKRSMVFMDTFNETYPGSMIVFVRVVSKNAQFPKKWLLQAVTQPEVSGNKITITNTKEGCNGKLVNTTLYPEIGETKIVGDIDKFISDGAEHPTKTTDASPTYRSGIRCEVVPENSAKEDIFLNAMYVTDADGNAPDLPLIYEETKEFMGVTLLDRMVMFSKSGNCVSNSFKITVRENETLCLITDVSAGKWKVSGNGDTFVLAASEENNAIVFRAKSGEYSVTPAKETESVSKLSFPTAEKRKTGDFATKYNGSYLYLPHETKIVNDVAYISTESLEKFGVNIIGNKAEKDINNAMLYIDSYIFNGLEFAWSAAPFEENGVLYVPAVDLSEIIGADISFDKPALLLSAEDYPIFDRNIILPKNYNSLGTKTRLFDGKLGKSISLKAGEDIVYAFDALKNINGIVLAGDSTDKFEFYYSADGNDYTLVDKSKITNFENYVLINCNFNAVSFRVKALTSGTLREASVIGENSNEKLFFADSGERNFNVNSSMEILAYFTSGFSNAGVYIDDTKIYTVPNGGIARAKVDISYFEPYKKYNLRLVADYNGKIYEESREIYLTRAKNSTLLLGKDYSSVSSGTIYNETHAKAQIVDGKLKIDINGNAVSNAPYIVLGTQKAHGIYETKVKVSSTSPFCELVFEVVDLYGNYAASGATTSVYSGFCDGEYEFLIKLDTVNSVLKIYHGGEQISSKRYLTDGAGSFRLTFKNHGSEPATVWVDDVSVYYREFNDYQTFLNASFGFENEKFGVFLNSDNYCGAGRLKALKVIKKDGKVESIKLVKFESLPPEFVELDVPDEFFADKDYAAEFYIIPDLRGKVSYIDVMLVLKYSKCNF